ncbi:dihydroorotase [Polynucleobacter cosmopolitanus]|uniref:Dihydroorotase n=1 Tax=Polynucleobacter cosmopolitanus TaxID=351345 RepID=A0A229FUX4_9BURK|nr:dihydroorotase [Polynucleobacter cosmopolitanus]OXL15744.1 dihydroorotase [Polynucleobacter cosmopolitanus]
MSSVNTIEITRPDDWHLHIRDGEVLADLLKHTASQFERAIIMPNLKPPVTTAEMAAAYKKRILAALPVGSSFTPLMVLYLTDNTSADEVKKAHQEGVVGFKLYPAGATTNSDAGVTDIKKCTKALEAMEACGMPLLLHGEVTHADVDVFDREAVFIDQVLEPLRQRHPGLKIIFEHITTKQAAQYVESADAQRFGAIAATITPQHLLYNRNAIFSGGIRPHYYCLPILKREEHRQELVRVATSGNPRFFLGTDSAPHVKGTKENACGCAGCYTAWHAMPLYAEVFDQANALDRLEAFASHFGPDFYNLPRNTGKLILKRQAQQIPNEFPIGTSTVVPLRAGESLAWTIVG